MQLHVKLVCLFDGMRQLISFSEMPPSSHTFTPPPTERQNFPAKNTNFPPKTTNFPPKAPLAPPKRPDFPPPHAEALGGMSRQNVWRERKEFYEGAEPGNADEEARMLEDALKMSRAQFKADQLRRKL